ncbi:uncharacterized protein LOC131018464 [Salvia miltiorrhiza]|uniref:uncharacterized protein LOC131018464 n=1 Tax=Salvia miltiorrhiza TaxID=226208 RepID=UPI0025ACCB97|nr:uncharacterized protein LOC131018464 [Salvia miltiorrhiza]
MATNKERLEGLESSMIEMKNSIQQLVEIVTSRASQPKKQRKKHNSHESASSGSNSSEESADDQSSESEGSVRSSASTQRQEKGRNIPIRMEFPRFTGTDPHVWIDRAEQYFEVQRIEKSEKVRVASFYLEGEANQWWRWFKHVNHHRKVSWRSFKKGLLVRFESSVYEDPNEAIGKLKQTGAFRNYLSEFERLMNALPHWHPSALLGIFMAGLKEELACEVRMWKPRNLQAAIELAKRKEEQLIHSRKSVIQSMKPSPKPASHGEETTTPVGASKTATAVRRLSREEVSRRRELNLCFNCNEKYAPGHVCKGGNAWSIEIYVDEGEDDDLEESKNEHISINALTGQTNYRTMRFSGKIENHSIHFLVDSGASLNFIGPHIAKKLHRAVVEQNAFNVRVANGEKLECRERFDDVLVTIQGLEFHVTLYTLPVIGADIVLGVPWLEQLGPILTDFKKLTMEFGVEGDRKVLRGIVSNSPQASGINVLLREWKSGAELYVVAEQCVKAIGNERIDDFVPKEIQKLLNNFPEVMAEPKGLPPRREFDHRIRLLDESRPVNVAPYRYAHFQKDEIERQVETMLQNGLIKRSTSPFSSPILLVKKKDGTWRFCTDYRALNEVTIKDRFPIPTIDDMLDELHGATYFSKLDLRAGYHQIRVHPEDTMKTAFRTHSGHYEYLVMPFGLCNAPSTFQATMNHLFRPYLRKFVLVFFDDILVYSNEWKSHLSHLRKVLEILQVNQLVIKPSKCFFGQKEVEYLGHFISRHGVRVDNRKVAAMETWPTPKSVTELRGFLGLTGTIENLLKGMER